MEYRISEYLGRFIIQAKEVKKETKGFLWWKKTEETIYWVRVDDLGMPLFNFRGIGRPPHKAFKTLEEAKVMVELFKKGPTYHNV